MNKYFFKDILERIISFEEFIARRWAANAHWRLMMVQWGLPPKPQHTDHHIDLFYKWMKTRDAMWLQRGVFSSIILSGGKVLELSCGDGFNSRNFYSLRASSIVACDSDEKAIANARLKNSAPNISYEIANITNSMPEGQFDNVIWDFGFPLLEYFTQIEVTNIFKNIKSRISEKKRIFSGYTIAQKKSENLAIPELTFSNAQELHGFLSNFFSKVFVFETHSPDRLNLYFWASDNPLPFADINIDANNLTLFKQLEGQ
ncbi:bifunctional 2-polyprenyl-6-hydroxyphenol methylase/3-demethylubiquinol 3-O-methyltransferase UbiG [Polynucleobacter sp. AP-Nino-20-G2]|uniref:class I SAM-dependent methyltransferase n=1 Tax=Polynucleobacter sp. AP-Nino-20-G2 TaxID=2576917 RepID=UPI001BFD8102|nr:class I SAM-dependent methyltransferase [Polynucleobacter sp. AP-Nino-20-G2]QWE16961.1 class I SAM-dependent methyltransferase [Polynucleobacter sp. AP-Nino-20-G2]